MRFLHTSDVHFLDVRGVAPWRYLGKRLTGAANLLLRRGRYHDERVFDAMEPFIPELGVERVVVTGDLTNLSLEPEFALAAAKLKALPVPVTVIPGNHDAYTRGSAKNRVFEAYLEPFMQGERKGAPYPFVTRHGSVALIGVSTAVPTPPFVATGTVGTAQLERLAQLLAEARAQGLCRVVLIHHPPVAGVSKRYKALTDTAAFAEVIAAQGADLILHGHEHRRIETSLPGPDGDVPVHGTASGTSLHLEHRHRACFSIYDASPDRIKRDLFEWNGTEFHPCAA